MCLLLRGESGRLSSQSSGLGLTLLTVLSLHPFDFLLFVRNFLLLSGECDRGGSGGGCGSSEFHLSSVLEFLTLSCEFLFSCALLLFEFLFFRSDLFLLSCDTRCLCAVVLLLFSKFRLLLRENFLSGALISQLRAQLTDESRQRGGGDHCSVIRCVVGG